MNDTNVKPLSVAICGAGPVGMALAALLVKRGMAPARIGLIDARPLDAAMRDARDATLSMPKLILPSIQVNMRGGHLPEPESNGTRYLKIPLDVL